MQVLTIDTIVSDPSIRNGEPVIDGTTIRVSDIVSYARDLSPDELAESFVLSLGQVYAALAYYHFHQSDIDAKIAENRTEADETLTQLEIEGRLRRFD